jgi:Na+/H+ antiporter NhaD/arsenite permease-like protein
LNVSLRPDLALPGTLCLLLLGGAVTPEEALRGFASPALVTIAALFIVAADVQKTGALAGVDRLLFARHGSLSRRTFQLASVTAGTSSVVNNTPIVAILAIWLVWM